MNVITEKIAAELIEDNDLHAIRLLDDDKQSIYLAYALVTLGREEHVFPCSVMDDWGKEMTGLQAYEWMRENGNHFPRADILAVGLAGDERQHFLREFELYVRYPVYALSRPSSSIVDAVPVKAVLMSDATVAVAARMKRPSDITGPLAKARVTWWLVPEDQTGLDFLRVPAEPTEQT